VPVQPCCHTGLGETVVPLSEIGLKEHQKIEKFFYSTLNRVKRASEALKVHKSSLK
jgi:hypothetical protein